MEKPLTVLGIETSCDDTAAAILRWQPTQEDQSPEAQHTQILANEVWAQHDDHRSFGGVVPEIAARSHVDRLDGVIARAIDKAGLSFADLDAISVTAGPGLIGGVLVGLTTAKAIALTHNISIIPVNHLEGHALSVRMTEHAPYPYLLLLISGGHTQLVRVDGLGKYQRLGTTIDDAAGEAFDKTAKLLNLNQPGGPSIERAALLGRPDQFNFPTPLKTRPGSDFSFSGLKTAVRMAAENLSNPNKQDIADLAYNFQLTVADHLAARTEAAMKTLESETSWLPTTSKPRLVIAGGVAANSMIRTSLSELCQSKGWSMVVPPPKYCTDNGAMIAWVGIERLHAGRFLPRQEAMSLGPRARWPLASPPEGAAFGSGKKGPKA